MDAEAFGITEATERRRTTGAPVVRILSMDVAGTVDEVLVEKKVKTRRMRKEMEVEKIFIIIG